MKFISKTLILSKTFDTMETADEWLDAMVKEYDEFEEIGCTIKGGNGDYTATIELFSHDTELDTSGPVLVYEGSREPDLFDAG